MSPTIFLSTVTSEFGKLRSRLASLLQRTKRVHVRHQDDFVERGVVTLHKLQEEAERSTVVFHVIGAATGSYPPADQVEDLLKRLPDFEFRFADVVACARDGKVTYTQWELWLAVYYGKRLCSYQFEERLNDEQRAHLALMRAHQLYAKNIVDDEGLYDQVILTLIELELLTDKEARKIIHLPYQSLGTLFKGREEFLSDLRKRLMESTTGVAAIAVRPQTLFGAGGIGKTRTAIEYAWRNSEHYSAILFVSASSPESLASSLANLVGVLGIDGMDGATDDVRLQTVLDWLQTHPGWLAILDNVDDDAAAQAVRSRLSALSAGHVLITSRLSSWSGAVEKLELELLTEEEAADYLLQASDQRIKSDDDHSQAKALGLKIGLLALGLEHAAAYINARAWSFCEYIQQWNQDEGSILAEFDLSQIDYPRELLITWRLSVDRLDAESRALLDILSWLAPQPISESTFDTLESLEVSHVRAALNLLTKYSLLKRDILNRVRVYTQHQLVQATTRCHQRNRQEGKSKVRLPRLVSALYWMNRECTGSPQDVRNWPKLEPFVPHLLAVCQFANREKENSAEHVTADLLNGTGMLLHYKAQHHEAEPLLRQSLEICERSCGREHPNVAIRLNNLALLLQATNRLPEAEPLMRRALKIDEKSYGPQRPEVATDLNNLALLLQATNRLREAEPLMRRAVEIDEKWYGPEHPDVARDLNNLAQLLKVTNRLFESEPLMARVVSIFESSFGVNHPNVAIALNNQASLLKATNRLSEVEPLMRRVVSIFESSYGTDHPNVATALNNLAQLLYATNRLSGAESLMRRALAIDEQSYGPEHPDVAIRLYNLGTLLLETNRLSEAEPLMRRVVFVFTKFEQSTGHEHPHMRAAMENYRSLLNAKGKAQSEIDLMIAELLQ